MRWCEENDVFYLFGMARNTRLEREIAGEMAEAEAESLRTGEPARRFRDFEYRTRESWSSTRRVVGKAEYLPRGRNPRFVVTNLERDYADARALYEDRYCARGDMENRIREHQRHLWADRTSAATMPANQLRLYFAAFAYVLLHGLRRLGLAGTVYARAQCDTIRLKFLKIGARVKVTSRRVRLSLSESYPHADAFRLLLRHLRTHPPWRKPG